MIKSKTITLALFVIILLIFFAYFSAYAIAFDRGNLITSSLDKIIEGAEKGDWADASAGANQLKTQWRQKKYIVMLNYAEEEYSTLENSIHRIIAATQIKDKSIAITEAEVAKEIWRNMKKLVPEP